MYIRHCPLNTAHYTWYFTHCFLHSAHLTLHITHFQYTIHSTHDTLHSTQYTQCTHYSAHNTVHTLQCTHYSTHTTVHTLQCTHCSAHRKLWLVSDSHQCLGGQAIKRDFSLSSLQCSEVQCTVRCTDWWSSVVGSRVQCSPIRYTAIQYNAVN